VAFVRVCGVDELGPNGIASFYITGLEVLVVRDSQGELHAFEGLCPHQDYPLVEGFFDGTTITCAAHGWMIDARTGRGINPSNCRIRAYPVKLEAAQIYADLDASLP
jgi:toluene monooxygenase system ferredoxin subunit